MIKKLFKRGLSLLLALVLVVTTFFIFDPSLLKLDADAYVDVGAANVGKFLSAQSLSATETIYLRPGTSDFQYYENYNYQTGEVANSVESSGGIYFSNADASAVYLVVNNVYEKGSSSTFSGKLTINGTAINTYAKLANGSATYTQGDIFAQTTGGTFDYKINSGSLTGCTAGKVYIIEWLIGYEIDGALHLTFAYTGVYAPDLGQAGVTYNLGREYSGSTLYQHGYSFLTGAMKYGGGNGKSNFTNPNVINVAGGIGSNTTFTAPLVSFVGYANNSSTFTVPGNAQVTDAYKSTTLFAQGTGNIGGGVLVSQQRYNKSESHLRTTWSDIGTYEDPTPDGTTTNGSENWSQTTGVGYILVDTSRYSNYDSIPNLSLGWAQFEHHYNGGANGLHKISVLDANHNGVSSVNVVNFSSDDWESGDEEGRSYTRGLFHIGGAIREGLTEFEFLATNRYNFGIGSASGDFYLTVALHTTTYSQAELRKTYNDALCSNLDYNNIAAYASSLDYTTFYNSVKATGEKLADPTTKNDSVDNTLKNFVANGQKALEEATATKVYFYVPEVIYLTPSTAGATTAVPFKWFADRANEDDGALTTNVAGKTSGNVYFHCAQAKSFSIKTSAPAGTTVSLSSYTLGNTISGNNQGFSMSGSAYNTTDQKITWTATWTNAAGQTFTVERTSTIYKPNYVASGGAGKSKRSSWGSGYMSGLIYVNGFSNSYASGGWKVKDSANTSLVPGWQRTGSNQTPDAYLDSVSNGPVAFNNSYEDSHSQTLSGLNLYLDRSRFTNYSQIPNFTWTVAITDYEGTDDERAGYFGYDAESGNIWNVPSNNLREGVYSGQISGATPAASATASSHYFQGYFKGKRGGTGQTTVRINFNCYSYDKSGLRDAYDYAMLKSNFLQKEYYTDSAWSAYTTALNNVINALQGVENTAATSYATYATTLKNQINIMIGAVTASGDTFTYQNTSNETVNGGNRDSVIKKGTATVHHVLIDFDEDGNLNTTTSGATLGATETKTYYYGETVYSGRNSYEGYNYFGYYRNEGTTPWTPSLGASVITGDVAAQGTYGSTGDNTDEFVRVGNLTYTYVYSKDPAGVYMDWGASEQAFKNKQNLADLTGVEIDTAFTGDDTLYGETSTQTSTSDNLKYESGVSIVNKTGTDAFSFTVKQPGYNIYTPKNKEVNNLFNFNTWTFNSVTDLNTEEGSFILNKESGEATTGFGGTSRVIKGQEGHKYMVVFDYENLTGNTGDRAQCMWFTYAANDSSVSDWGGTEDQVRAGRTYNTIAPYGSGTYSVVIDTPSGFPYFSLRFETQTTQGNSSVKFSNIYVYDVTDSNQYAKMTDIFLPGIAKNLEGGKTYTVSFKSSLRYDDYRWYANNMYGEHEPGMDWAHEQGTIQMFISSTNGSDDLYNYTVPVRVTTGISDGGTIGTFELPAGCSKINLGFCITNDTAIGGWVSDIRITDGDYVEVGAAGETYSMPDPLRVGHTFTGWSEASTPFYGSLVDENDDPLRRNYTYGTKSDTVIANWEINKYDITFDNEFKFDEYVWTGNNYTTATIDKDNNTVRMVAKESSGNPDAYIGAYNNSQTGYMTLIPGHTYKVSYDWVNNNTSVASSVGFAPYVFYGDTVPFSYTSPNLKSFTYTATGASGTHTFEFTMPAGLQYAAFRYGITTSKADITFSDLYIQDISRGTTTIVKDTTVSEPLYNSANIHGVVRDYQQLLVIKEEGSDLTTLPTMTSNGYFFKGWYTEKAGGTQVTDTSGYITEVGTNQLWSQWQVHIEYDLSKKGGSYLDNNKAPQTSQKYDVGQTVNVKIADYVPYKVGYNFAGWKDKFKGETYQPGQTVEVLNYSLMLEPIWEPATEVEKNTPTPGTGFATLHPGQVYYYAYTPANNNEYVSGYVNGATLDVENATLTVSLYNGSSKLADGGTSKTYGVESLNSLVSGALTKGTTYYFGITSSAATKTVVSDANFQVSEHTIKYKLSPNGGSVSPETVTGHYNTTTELPLPVRTGHTFAGWKHATGTYQSSIDSTELINSFLDDTPGAFEHEIELIAQWDINSYDFNVYAYYNTAINSTSYDTSYVLGETGGTVAVGGVAGKNGFATKEIVFEDDVTFVATPKTGYSFKGWYDGPTFTDGKITNWGTVKYVNAEEVINSMPANDITLYARFDINTYVVNLYAYSDNSTTPGEYEASTQGGKVYFDNGTAASSATQTYVHGQKYTMHAVADKGYKFEGWFYGNNSLTGTASYGSESVEILVTEAHNYKAKFTVQKYQLTVNPNGGTVNQSLYEGYMGAQVTVEAPTRDGYTFDGWTILDSGSSAEANGTMVENRYYTFGAGNDRASAKWKVNNYTVTVDPAGGTATINYYLGDDNNTRTMTITQSTQIQMAYNSTASLPAPTKVGHAFAGWTTQNIPTEAFVQGSEGHASTFKVGMSNDAVITATWTVNSYPLYVDVWNDAANSEGVYTDSGHGGTVTVGDLTGTKVESLVSYDSTATVVATPSIGYSFKGWTTAVPSTEENLEFVSRDTTFETAEMGISGLHYYAVFGINRYTVTVNAAYNTAGNYETFTPGNNGGTVTGGGIVTHGQSATFEATPATGYNFDGWYNGDVEVSTNSTYSATITSDTALTARFAISKYTITTTAISNYANDPERFDGNPLAGTFEGSKEYYYGQQTEIKAVANPGYVFIGWFSDYGCTQEIGDGTDTLRLPVTSSESYYAKFEVLKVGVNLYAMSNYDLNGYSKNDKGGTVSFDKETYAATAEGECYFDGRYEVYAKAQTGYAFEGWYTNEDLTGTPLGFSYDDGGFYVSSGTAGNANGVALYAKFSVNSYDLGVYAHSNTGNSLANYDNNSVGGTVSISGAYLAGDVEADQTNARAIVKVYFNRTANITAEAGTGYTFEGWYKDAALSDLFSSEETVETAAMGIEGLNYYAKFEVGRFDIIYDSNGGSDVSNTKANAYYNHTFTVISERPERAGYTFFGWSVENPDAVQADYVLGGTIEAGTIADWYLNDEDGKVTLYAVWILNANYIIATQAYSSANNEYKIGTTGGTVEVVPGLHGEVDTETGNVVVPAGEIVSDYLNFIPASGYAFKYWRWKTLKEDFTPEQKISATWGNEGTGSTTMPSQILYVVAFFEIQTFYAEAKAYYNTAAAIGDYSYGATGGTVKCGQTGKNASNAVSERANFGREVLFIATPARGYSFVGWYAQPTETDGIVNDWGTDAITTDTNLRVVVEDDSAPGKESANKYYAVFNINSYKAVASIRTYTVREELIYSLEDAQRPGGDPSGLGGTVGISMKAITEAEVKTGAWKNDADWKKTGIYANEIYPEIGNVYYGQRVYFAAQPNIGYTFGGWYTQKDADYFGEYLVEEEALSYSRIMREGEIYVEAKFVPVSFTLILDENGGVEGNPTEIILTYNSSVRIEESSAPTKTGSTFLGWADAPDSTEALYKAPGTILPDKVNSWYESLTDGATAITVYAIWKTALITVNFDKQGATEGANNAQITVGEKLPSLDVESIPRYEGFVFGGYYSEIGGKGIQYYNADGTSTSQTWNTPTNGTIYAKWTCPVLESIDYVDGEWQYTYLDKDGGKNPISVDAPVVTATALTEQVKNDANLMWWTKNDSQINISFVEAQKEEVSDINLNHYSDFALTDLYAAVKETDEPKEMESLTQPQANAYVARMAKDMELDFADNVKAEKNVPTVKLYETSEKISKIKGETIKLPEDSANGSVYGEPTQTDSANYTFAGKWSYTEKKAVDYYLYTNSPNPVIALEIGDGAVASTISSNTSSYPTKADITDNAAGFAYIDGAQKSYEMSAVKATDDLSKAWFTPYTEAGIGTKHDYNAKTVVYLTPKFTASGTQNEIVYTIKASDDAAVSNEGISKSEIEVPENQSLANMRARFSSYSYNVPTGEIGKAEDITICICYHNSMNGDSDEGTLDATGPYMQMYMDQIELDKMINQLHLFRTSGGAANGDFPTVGEKVYPIADKNYPYAETGCTLGSFYYVFDSTTEPAAASFAAAGTEAGYTAAKEAIIDSVLRNASEVKEALANENHELNFRREKGLGYQQIVSWSNNFYPKTGSYVYVHLVDRWGNVFNRVWECFNVDSYPSTINGIDGTSVYNVFEDGGSNIDTMNLDGAKVEFILDDNSSYDNGVFTTTGNTVSIATGEANKTYNLIVTDKATNTNTAEVTTDSDGVLVLNIEDACADLSAGAYTFTLNGETVNLYAGVTKLVYSAAITEVSQIGMNTVVTAKTSKDVIKLQLVEGVATRTYTLDEADSVVENEDGTLTWTLSLKPSKGVHSYALRARTVNGWETTEYTLTTEVVEEFVSTPVALKSVYDANVEVGEKVVIKAKALVGTQKLQLVYPNGSTSTFNRSDATIITTVDDVETWALKSSAYNKAGEYEVTVRAKYADEWQDASAKTSTVTVTEKVVDTTPVILSAEAQSASAKVYDYVTFKVVTNSNATKIRFNYSGGDTWTFAESPEYTVVNADGTKTWTVAVKFYVLGENEITFSTRNAEGWVDAQTFGTIEITK